MSDKHDFRKAFFKMTAGYYITARHDKDIEWRITLEELYQAFKTRYEKELAQRLIDASKP